MAQVYDMNIGAWVDDSQGYTDDQGMYHPPVAPRAGIGTSSGWTSGDALSYLTNLAPNLTQDQAQQAINQAYDVYGGSKAPSTADLIQMGARFSAGDQTADPMYSSLLGQSLRNNGSWGSYTDDNSMTQALMALEQASNLGFIDPAYDTTNAKNLLSQSANANQVALQKNAEERAQSQGFIADLMNSGIIPSLLASAITGGAFGGGVGEALSGLMGPGISAPAEGEGLWTGDQLIGDPSYYPESITPTPQDYAQVLIPNEGMWLPDISSVSNATTWKPAITDVSMPNEGMWVPPSQGMEGPIPNEGLWSPPEQPDTLPSISPFVPSNPVEIQPVTTTNEGTPLADALKNYTEPTDVSSPVNPQSVSQDVKVGDPSYYPEVITPPSDPMLPNEGLWTPPVDTSVTPPVTEVSTANPAQPAPSESTVETTARSPGQPTPEEITETTTTSPGQPAPTEPVSETPPYTDTSPGQPTPSETTSTNPFDTWLKNLATPANAAKLASALGSYFASPLISSKSSPVGSSLGGYSGGGSSGISGQSGASSLQSQAPSLTTPQFNSSVLKDMELTPPAFTGFQQTNPFADPFAQSHATWAGPQYAKALRG